MLTLARVYTSFLVLCSLPVLFREELVEFEEFGYTLAFGHGFDGEAVSCHHRAVVVLMSLAEFHGHRQFVVEVCQL